MQDILVGIGVVVFLGWLIPSPISWFSRRALRKQHQVEIQTLQAEIETLKVHLHVKMEIDAEGMIRVRGENEKLRQIIQNLRISNQTLSHQPEQAELRSLQVYDRSVKLMQQRFPVFIPTWQTLIAQVEKDMKQVKSGLVPPLTRVVHPAGQLQDSPLQDAKRLSKPK